MTEDEKAIEALMENGIDTYVHCRQCLAERPAYMSMAEFARLAFGRTPHGLQVWCLRHNMNVYHLDLAHKPRPRYMGHGIQTATPYAADLNLACYRCGFDPASDEDPTRVDP
jgi:hypothetical protein